MRYDLMIEPMTWSYSRLTAFEQCPYQWFQKYLCAIHGESNFFAQYGTLIHKILQKYLTQEIQRDELLSYFLLHYFTDITAKAPSQKTAGKYLNQGRQYFKNLTFPERDILGVEEKLSFEFAGHPFVGVLDVLSSDQKGRLYITDHKSRMLKPRSRRKKPLQADLELDRYLRQLYIYAYGVHTLYDRYPDYLEFNCFRSGTWIREPFVLSQMMETEAWAEQLIRTIAANSNWNACPDYWFCKHICDVNADCEYRDFL